MTPQLTPEDIGLYLKYLATSVETPRAGREGVSLVVGGERRLNSFYATCFFDEV
jgi:hypothetical protein